MGELKRSSATSSMDEYNEFVAKHVHDTETRLVFIRAFDNVYMGKLMAKTLFNREDPETAIALANVIAAEFKTRPPER